MEINVQELKERVAVICRKKATTGKLTEVERADILTLCDVAGVEVEKTNCKQCIIDAGVLACQKVTQKQEDGVLPAARQYVLRVGTDVIFGGIRINSETITDTLAENIISLGFPKSFFTKLPK